MPTNLDFEDMIATTLFAYDDLSSTYELDEIIFGYLARSLPTPNIRHADRTFGLFQFLKTSGLKRMTTSTSDGGVPNASPSVTKKKAKKKAKITKEHDEVVSGRYSSADHGENRYQSKEFYEDEKRLINRTDISPDPPPLSQEMSPSRRISMRAGLWATIHHHCRIGNPAQTKMDEQLCSPLACMKT